ncbi:hypothetical protein D9M70_614050 [compost metagenome]
MSEMNRYASTPKPRHAASDKAALAASVRSKMPMMTTSDVSLNRAMKMLTSGGITIFSACGRMILRICCQ